ncbi:SMI1/KNR4 family protein [Streptomyces sp. NPDC050439]|uniref:SMI1/KNR4 family protein n=1 Tax=unclassified Streptomyces TaxID=2593676 RepID=UPI003413A600
MKRLIDLDQAAAQISARRRQWTAAGLVVGPVTWRDEAAAWPQRLETSRSEVRDPDSVGIHVTGPQDAELLVVLYRGGWADVDFIAALDTNEEPVCEGPEVLSPQVFGQLLDGYVLRAFGVRCSVSHGFPWKEVAERAFAEARFSVPVDAVGVAAAERRLGSSLPADLVSLLQETDGIVGHYGTDTVWPLERIVEDNLRFWSDSSFADLYMPFDALLFFGDNGGGDQFAFVRKPARADIFVWQHEDDSRRWVARDLTDYLKRSLTDGEDNWYE